ncbi:MAG: glycosyl hydrolase family 2, partial [Tannerella sp.]|nr:glycosyl hydrolase family 2 [Tannerella sp.]
MKHIVFIFTFLVGSFMASSQEWPVIQWEAQAATRWWWFGSAVDKENLSFNLESLSKAGLRGVEITPIYGVQGNESHEIPYLSNEWMQMLQHTVDEGKRLDIRVDMSTGTGWPFGGPHVSMEDAATRAIFREYSLGEGQSLSDRIEPTEANQRLIAQLSCLMAISGNRKIDLTDKVHDGYLQWKAPAGNWRLIALFIGKTLQQVKRAAPGGEGFVIDHYSKKAVDQYLSVFEKAFNDTQTAYPHSFFNDSYEAYGADWTPGFLTAFEERRGYKLENYFPQFLDSNRTEITRRIVSDYRETLSELLLENFTQRWTAWANRCGSTTRNQAHGSPGNLIDFYAAVDIPECEGFGLSEFNISGLRQDSLTRKNDSDLSMLKYASSAAHISGKNFTSSETFTWLTEHFRTSLAQCKPDLDLMFTAGVNRIFFHGTPYSPKDTPWPGRHFYASVNMSPTNSIWRDIQSFTDYIARCQSFLQMGQPDNDFLLYLPLYDIWDEQPGRYLAFDIHKMAERAPAFIEVVHKIRACGYDLDYISDNFIRTTQCKDGLLQTTGGSRYKALIVPPARLIPADVLQQLLALVQNGAQIIFLENYPADVPGFAQLDQRKKEFQETAKMLPKATFRETQVFRLGNGQIITGSDFAETLKQSNAQAEEMQTVYGLIYIRRSHTDGHHYFVASLQEKDMEGWVSLGVKAQSVALYNPVTGESGLARLRRQDDRTQVYLQLRSGESVIVRTYDSETTGKSWFYPVELSPAIT